MYDKKETEKKRKAGEERKRMRKSEREEQRARERNIGSEKESGERDGQIVINRERQRE